MPAGRFPIQLASAKPGRKVPRHRLEKPCALKVGKTGYHLKAGAKCWMVREASRYRDSGTGRRQSSILDFRPTARILPAHKTPAGRVRRKPWQYDGCDLRRVAKT